MSAWLLAAMLCAATTAAPAELQRAEELMARYKYAEARAALAKARAAKGLDRASLLRILELQGVAAGQMRQAAPATAAFKELLTLDPGHKLDADYAPRVTTPFMEAGQLVNEQGALELKAGRSESSPAKVTAISVELVRDPMKHGRSLVFHVLDGPAWRATSRPATAGVVSVTVDGAEVKWWAELLGDNDAQLALVGSEQAPQVATPPPPVVLAPPPKLPAPEPPVVSAAAPSSPVRTASYFVLGGAAAAAGVGAFFGLKSSGELGQLSKAARDGNGVITGLTERQANALATDGARDGAIANACFIGAGALAAGAVVMWLVGAPVAVTPAPGGVAVSGRFP